MLWLWLKNPETLEWLFLLFKLLLLDVFCALAGKAFWLSGFPNIVCSTTTSASSRFCLVYLYCLWAINFTVAVQGLVTARKQSSVEKIVFDLESEAMGDLSSIPTGGNILSLEFFCFHAVKTKMSILAFLCVCEKPDCPKDILESMLFPWSSCCPSTLSVNSMLRCH